MKNNSTNRFQLDRIAFYGRTLAEYLKMFDLDLIEQHARAQLMMIEKINSLNITNRDEVAQLIARKVDNERQVLTICTSLNSWVLLNKKSGNVVTARCDHKGSGLSRS